MSTPKQPRQPRNGEDRARAMLDGMAGFVRAFRAPHAWSDMDDRSFLDMAFLACLTFERHPERSMRMLRLFENLAQRFGTSDRLRFLGILTAFIEEGRASAEALMPCVLFDPSDAVIAVASREFALLHASPAGDPTAGARLLLSRVQANEMFAVRQAAVVAGLVSLGDMRLAPLVLGRTDMFRGAAARRAVICAEGAFCTALQVEFLLDWLERSSAPEDAIAAADALAALPTRSADGAVAEVDRVFPSTAAPAGEELHVVQHMAFPQYLERIRPRLATVALLAELAGDRALAARGPSGITAQDAARVVAAIQLVMDSWSRATPTSARSAA